MRSLSIKLYCIYVCYMSIALYSFQYSLQFHVTTLGLGMFYLRIWGSASIYIYGGQDNFVGITTCYVLDSLGFIPQ